jgi:protocatechuate 3,4-dioxygenase beta subunit
MTRREALGAFAGVAVLVGCGANDATSTDGGVTTDAATTDGTATNACVLDPNVTKGPYWIDEKLDRSDVRSDTNNVASPNPRPGLPLVLDFTVFAYAAGTCTPLEGAQVDVWHCDGSGVYSDVNATTGQNFLRGYQVTDATGNASFTTIYPGWYSGRTVHIHVKVRIFDSSSNTTTEATTQVFFDDTTTDAVFAANAPYSSRGGRDTRNSADSIYNGQTVLLLDLQGSASSGYTGSISIGVQVGTVSAG